MFMQCHIQHKNYLICEITFPISRSLHIDSFSTATSPVRCKQLFNMGTNFVTLVVVCNESCWHVKW